MQIGQAAAASGVSAKMIRHYEAIGLIGHAERRASNYRSYAAGDVDRLSFIRRARVLGFSIEQIRQLLGLWDDRARASADVKRIALSHLADLETRIRELRLMSATLNRLVAACEGGDRPDCPILDDLGSCRTSAEKTRRNHQQA